MRVAFRDKALLVFNKSLFVSLKDYAPIQANMCETHLEAELK